MQYMGIRFRLDIDLFSLFSTLNYNTYKYFKSAAKAHLPVLSWTFYVFCRLALNPGINIL